MIIRVIAIKELFGKNYKIDLLFFGVPEEKIREILHEYKLVALELHEYPKEKVESYSKIKILLEYNNETYRALSNYTELEELVYLLSIIGFNIKNINYVDGQEIEQSEVDKIMLSGKEKAGQWLHGENDKITRDNERNSAIYDDEKLSRILKLTENFLEKIPTFLEKAKGVLTNNELKGLENQWQELSKLKMGNNVDKISSFLEEAYDNYNNLEQKYYSLQESPNIDVSGSNVTDVYLLSEISKLEKAKSLVKIGGAKSSEDVLYGNLGGLLLYFKLIGKDLKFKFKNFSGNSSKIFRYLILLFFSIIVLSSIYLSFMEENLYLSVIMVYSGIFGLVFFCISFIKKEKIVFNILLLLLGILISLILIRFFKQIFIF